MSSPPQSESSPPGASAAAASSPSTAPPPPPPSEPVKSPTKRTRSTNKTAPKAATKSKKRARLTVAPDETTQVTCLDSRYKLHLADADAYYIPDLVEPDLAQTWHDELLKLDEWYRPTLKVYGREVTQSRQIAAFATDPELQVKYSGTEVQMSYDYPPLLREIQDLVEAKLGVKFNHCMLNLYENGQIYIGNHRDNRENRVIASLSLGAPRTFILTHDKPPSAPLKREAEPEVEPSTGPATDSSPSDPAATRTPAHDPPLRYSHRFVLENGSLVVMQGTMQQFWKHQVPKEKKVDQSRISLTFRQLVF